MTPPCLLSGVKSSLIREHPWWFLVVYTDSVSVLSGSSDHFYEIFGQVMVSFFVYYKMYSIWPISVFLNWGNFATQRAFADIWRHFRLSQFWGGS